MWSRAPTPSLKGRRNCICKQKQICFRRDICKNISWSQLIVRTDSDRQLCFSSILPFEKYLFLRYSHIQIFANAWPQRYQSPMANMQSIKMGSRRLKSMPKQPKKREVVVARDDSEYCLSTADICSGKTNSFIWFVAQLPELIRFVCTRTDFVLF